MNNSNFCDITNFDLKKEFKLIEQKVRLLKAPKKSTKYCTFGL